MAIQQKLPLSENREELVRTASFTGKVMKKIPSSSCVYLGEARLSEIKCIFMHVFYISEKGYSNLTMSWN